MQNSWELTFPKVISQVSLKSFVFFFFFFPLRAGNAKLSLPHSTVPGGGAAEAGCTREAVIVVWGPTKCTFMQIGGNACEATCLILLRQLGCSPRQEHMKASPEGLSQVKPTPLHLGMTTTPCQGRWGAKGKGMPASPQSALCWFH